MLISPLIANHASGPGSERIAGEPIIIEASTRDLPGDPWHGNNQRSKDAKPQVVLQIMHALNLSGIVGPKVKLLDLGSYDGNLPEYLDRMECRLERYRGVDVDTSAVSRGYMKSMRLAARLYMRPEDCNFSQADVFKQGWTRGLESDNDLIVCTAVIRDQSRAELKTLLAGIKQLLAQNDKARAIISTNTYNPNATRHKVEDRLGYHLEGEKTGLGIRAYKFLSALARGLKLRSTTYSKDDFEDLLREEGFEIDAANTQAALLNLGQIDNINYCLKHAA